MIRGAKPSLLALVLATGLCGSTYGQVDASSGTPELGQAWDEYFSDPAGPAVYRGLAGMGDPHLHRWESLDAFVSPADSDALLHRLFPDVALSRGEFPRYRLDNCRLEHALPTLEARIAALGADAPYVNQWIRVQTAVFSVCRERGDGLTSTVTLPPPMATGDAALARLQRADRAYQAASLLFYQQHFEAAAQAFDHVAATPSADQPYARYMALAIRAGTHPNRYKYEPLIPAARSLAAARKLLADPTAEVVHPYAYDLIGWIAANDQGMNPRRAQVRQVLDALEAPRGFIASNREARRRYASAQQGLGLLFSRFDDQAAFLDGSIPADHTGSLAMAEAARADPMAAWLVFPVSPYQTTPWALVTAVQGEARIEAELVRRSPSRFDPANPWSHLKLMWDGSRYSPDLWAIIDAEMERARRGGDDRASAGFGLDFFHQVRTALMYAPERSASEAALDQVIARLNSFPLKQTEIYGRTLKESLSYLMLKGRLQDARKLRDATDLVNIVTPKLSEAPNEAESLPHQPELAGMLLALAEDETHLAKLLVDNQDPLLNRLSIHELHRLAEREDVSLAERAMFARTAWARTYALGRPVPSDLDRLMRWLNPDVVAHWVSKSGRPINPDDREALRDLLNAPSLNSLINDRKGGLVRPPLVGVDHNKRNDDNWWCPWSPKSNDDELGESLRTVFGNSARHEDWKPLADSRVQAVLKSSFIMRRSDPAELAALTRIKSAPQLLTERAITWVQRPGLFGSRTGQDEALAAAVESTRWGCDWAGRHGVYSRAAFQLLHARFPASPAAKRTKYWFDCNGECSPRSEDLPPAPPVTLARPRPSLGEIIERWLHPRAKRAAPTSPSLKG